MDVPAVLAAFDEQVRRSPMPEPTIRIEHDAPVVRVVSDGDAWNGVVWSRLDETNADTVIAAEVARFSASGHDWEWKYYSYDEPTDLPDRLRAAGLVADPEESLMVAAIADLDLEMALPEGVRLVPVTDAATVDALVQAVNEAFGEPHDGLGAHILSDVDRAAADRRGSRRDGGGTPDRGWSAGAPSVGRVRQPVGWRHRPGLAAEGGVPLAGRLPSGDCARPRLSLSAGRRIRSQPSDP